VAVPASSGLQTNSGIRLGSDCVEVLADRMIGMTQALKSETAKNEERKSDKIFLDYHVSERE
jgi:hypothetical protein